MRGRRQDAREQTGIEARCKEGGAPRLRRLDKAEFGPVEGNFSGTLTETQINAAIGLDRKTLLHRPNIRARGNEPAREPSVQGDLCGPIE